MFIKNKKAVWGTCLCVGLLYLLYIYVTHHRVHRISEDNTCEYLYLTSDIAISKNTFPQLIWYVPKSRPDIQIAGMNVKRVNIKKLKSVRVNGDFYSLGIAHYQGAPEYKFQTGDITDKEIVHNIKSINYDNNIIYGTFVKGGVKGGYISWFAYDTDKKELKLFDDQNRTKNFLRKKGIVYHPIPVRQFMD